PRRENDFARGRHSSSAIGGRDLDSACAGAVEQHLCDVRAQKERQICAAEVGMQKGAGGADARAVTRNVHIDIADAVAHWPIHVVKKRKPHLYSRLDDGAGGRMGIAWAADVNRPADATPFVGTALPILLRLEHRQDVLERPTFGAAFGPGVVVSLHAAAPNHRIDGTAAAKNM